MGAATISIAMTTYNGARFLGDQLATFVAQTRQPDELVVCDDQSSDQTIDILNDFAKSAPFAVRVQQNPARLGYVRNFRRAASLCTGDLIAFSDQDDWWHVEKLARLEPLFADPGVQMAYHNARIVDEQRVGNDLLWRREVEEGHLNVDPLPPWHHSYGMAQIFRASLRRFDHLWDRAKNDVTDPVDIMSHDQWYIFLALVCGKVRFLDEPLTDYRQHGGNSVGATPGGRGLGSRLLQRLEHYGRQDERRAEAARARADVLRAMAEEDAAVRARASGVARDYEQFAEKLDRRFRSYARGSLPARMVQFIDAVRRGDYSGWPWGFDKRSIVRDLWSGVMLGRAAEPK